MVTFNCEVCNATVPKKGTEKHYYRCPNAYYTCIDCSTTFDDGYSYQQHTECISEDEKYQKGLYKGKKKAKTNNNNNIEPPKKIEQTKKKMDPPKKVEASKKKVEKRYFKDGESLYNCLKSIKNKDEKKKLLKSIILKQSSTDDNNSFIISM
ncbi:hypothetical protein MOUN0_B04500 [Monosporozyma unispora]|nr:hypothetical protein C6P44_003977 [Kazachstania unispora]